MSKSCAHVRQIWMRNILPCAAPGCPLGVDAPNWNVALPPKLLGFASPDLPIAFVSPTVRTFARYQRVWACGSKQWMWKDVTL